MYDGYFKNAYIDVYVHHPDSCEIILNDEKDKYLYNVFFEIDDVLNINVADLWHFNKESCTTYYTELHDGYEDILSISG